MFQIGSRRYPGDLAEVCRRRDRAVRGVEMQGRFRAGEILIISALGACASPTIGADDVAPRKARAGRVVSFGSDISPILRASCGRCHGEKALKGELDLRSLAGIRKGGESGPVL